jgi:methyl-accepting chemotaxis protein
LIVRRLVGLTQRPPARIVPPAADSLRPVAWLLEQVGESSAQLSIAAGELLKVAAEQVQATAQTSAELEALARGNASIADSIASVVTRAGELRTDIQSVQTELAVSTEKQLANATRLDEIQGVIGILEDIADLTALLALNAAIEAARAGHAGRGFAVVADEVRRLAERSKAAAAQIAQLAEGAQSTSHELVAAIERRGQQFESWMQTARAMAEVSGVVQPAVRLQQEATTSIEVAIELIAERSRAVAAAAQGLATSASGQVALTAEITDTRWNLGERP